jgi:hypothetical protein
MSNDTISEMSVGATAPTPQSSHDPPAWAWLCAELQRERERRRQAEANAVVAQEWAIAAEQRAAAERLVMMLRSELMIDASPRRWW